MSDEEREYIEVESDDDDNKSNGIDLFDVVISNPSPADKRAHHNALERKRRDHIKESFCSLRDCVPNLNGEKSSRAQILKKATDYIASMKGKNMRYQMDIDAMRQQNKKMEEEVAALERIKATSEFSQKSGQRDSSEKDSEYTGDSKSKRKKLRVS